MSIPIQNASSVALNQNSGTMPNLTGAILDWFQPMTFTTIVKSVVNFQNVETPTNIDFRGVWQPLSKRDLLMKPEGQRSWIWMQLHSDTTLRLSPDEVVTYLGQQFRVMASFDYRLDGYYEYHLVNDYNGVGPNP